MPKSTSSVEGLVPVPPPRVSNAAFCPLLAANRASALAILIVTVMDVPFWLELVTIYCTGTAGQYQLALFGQSGMPSVVESRKNSPFDPLSIKLLYETLLKAV